MFHRLIALYRLAVGLWRILRSIATRLVAVELLGAAACIATVLVACGPSQEPSWPDGALKGASDVVAANDGAVNGPAADNNAVDKNVTNDGAARSRDPANNRPAAREGALSSDDRSVNHGHASELASGSALFTARFEASSAAPDGSRREGPLLRGATLRSGDWLWVNIAVVRQAHFYVVQLDRDGRPELLFPSALERDEPRQAGSSLRVPPLPEVFALDENVGTEHLVVIASVKPIAATDVQLRELLEAAQAGSNPAVTSNGPVSTATSSAPPAASRVRVRTPPQPQPSSPSDGYLSRVADRGILRINPEAAVEAREDASGVAIFRLTFDHR